MNLEVTLTEGADIEPEVLLRLYTSVGWAAYTQDVDALAAAVKNSTHVVTARNNEDLIGLARVISDDVSVMYLQDILVSPEWQHQGVGRSLLQNCLDRFAHVRQKVLLTDDLPAQHRFYESMGYTNTREPGNLNLHTFVQIAGVEVEES